MKNLCNHITKRFFLNHLIIATFAVLAAFTSCRDDEGDNGKGDVYVAGWERCGQPDNYGSKCFVAKLWKKGIAQDLTDGTYDAQAFSVYVSGSDVYVAGHVRYGQPDGYGSYFTVATLWKNGVAQDLSDGTGHAQAFWVCVSGRDVYVGGSKLWKNGTDQNIPAGGRSPYFVSGKDVYVCSTNGTLWKNGNVFGTYPGQAEGIYVSGKDVYLAITEYFVLENFSLAKIWTNGTTQNLTESTYKSQALSVYALGKDIYVAGYEHNAENVYAARLWKNGVVQNLNGGNNGGIAYSVFVSGKDVYVAGVEHNHAILWKNGERQNLNDGTNWGHANSVFVAK